MSLAVQQNNTSGRLTAAADFGDDAVGKVPKQIAGRDAEKK